MSYLTTNKKVKHIWSLLLAFITICYFIISCSDDEKINVNDKTVLHTGFTNEEIVEVVNRHLPRLTEPLQNGINIEVWGFNSVDELDQIQVGIPYLKISLFDDFNSDKEYDYFSKYIYNSKIWHVPLKIEDETRCFMFVWIQADTLAYLGAGDAEWAKRFNEPVDMYGIQENKNRYLIYEDIDCKFIMIDSLDDFILYPASDSIYFYCKNAYKTYNSFEEFFYSFKE